MTEEEFKPEYDRLAARYEKLAERISAIQREKDDREYRAKRISLFMRMLAGQEECLEFDSTLFTAFVEKVVVSGTKKEVRLSYVLRDGLEYNVCINVFHRNTLGAFHVQEATPFWKERVRL